jgi:hypothetical protein
MFAVFVLLSILIFILIVAMCGYITVKKIILSMCFDLVEIDKISEKEMKELNNEYQKL